MQKQKLFVNILAKSDNLFGLKNYIPISGNYTTDFSHASDSSSSRSSKLESPPVTDVHHPLPPPVASSVCIRWKSADYAPGARQSRPPQTPTGWFAMARCTPSSSVHLRPTAPFSPDNLTWIRSVQGRFYL